MLSVQSRNVKLENIENSEGSNITLNVLIGKKQATLSANNNIQDINAQAFLKRKIYGRVISGRSLLQDYQK